MDERRLTLASHRHAGRRLRRRSPRYVPRARPASEWTLASILVAAVGCMLFLGVAAADAGSGRALALHPEGNAPRRDPCWQRLDHRPRLVLTETRSCPLALTFWRVTRVDQDESRSVIDEGTLFRTGPVVRTRRGAVLRLRFSYDPKLFVGLRLRSGKTRVQVLEPGLLVRWRVSASGRYRVDALVTTNIPKPDGTRVIEEMTWTFQVDASR